MGYRGGFNVAGAAETNNNFSVNGIDNNDTGINGPTFLPSIDSIQEFKLLTGIFPAEYGHSSGSQVIVVTKSGTNQIRMAAPSSLSGINCLTPPTTSPPPGSSRLTNATSSAERRAARSGKTRRSSFTAMKDCGCGSRLASLSLSR